MTGQREHRGRTADLAGRAAEVQVAGVYEARGAVVLERRWRGKAGEVDLILREGAVVVFVEVKRSAGLDGAAAALSPRQQARIMAAAEEYAGGLPQGSLSEMRLDVALVDGRGGCRIMEGALGP